MTDRLQEIRAWLEESLHSYTGGEDARMGLEALDLLAAETKRREAAEAVGKEYALLFTGAPGKPKAKGYLYFSPGLRDALIRWRQVKAEAEKEAK